MTADTPTPMRATYLHITDLALLNDWAENLRLMFHETTAYLVGSALLRPDYRDVDVRLILRDDEYRKLAKRLSINRLNRVVSMWGEKATGLKVDFQVQQMTAANREFGDRRRHPLIHRLAERHNEGEIDGE